MRLHIYRCLPNMRTLLVFFQVLLSEGVMKEEATSSTCRIITTLTPSEYGCLYILGASIYKCGPAT